MHTRFKFSLVAATVAAMGILLVPAAMAQYAPAGGDFVTCTPDPAEPGDDVSCEAGVFQAGSDVDVVVTASTLLDTTVAADGDGSVAFAFTIPADHPTGAYKVTLRGIGPDGEPKTLVDTGAIVEETAAGAADPELSATGVDASTSAIAAIVLLALGGGAVYGTRKKKAKVSA